MRQFWVGTYTGASGAGRGIYRMGSRPDGTLELVGLAAEASSPSYLAVHPRVGVLYAAAEGPSGAVLAFDVDGPDLRPRGRVAVPAGPCHVAVHPDGGHVLAASYGAGTITALPLAGDSSPTGAAYVVDGHGSGPRTDRQDGPHAHAVAVAPDGTVLSTDLGADVVRALRIDPGTGELRPVADLALPPGCGPRHLVVHPTGHVYVLTELAHTVIVLRPRAGYADLVVVGESPATVEPVDDGSLCAAIKLGADARFLYTSTRGADVVTTHEIGDNGARLRAMADTSSGGRWPRDLCVDGDRLHVANEHSGSIASFALGPDSGVPHALGAATEVPAPVCIVPDPGPSPP